MAFLLGKPQDTLPWGMLSRDAWVTRESPLWKVGWTGCGVNPQAREAVKESSRAAVRSLMCECLPRGAQELASPRGICLAGIPSAQKISYQQKSQLAWIHNFAKTTVCCAFLDSEKAHFHIFLLPPFLYSTLFSSSSHASHPTLSQTQAIMSSEKSLVVLSNSDQEWLLGGPPELTGPGPLGIRQDFLTGGRGAGGGWYTGQHRLFKVTPRQWCHFLFPWLILEKNWQDIIACITCCRKEVLSCVYPKSLWLCFNQHILRGQICQWEKILDTKTMKAVTFRLVTI